MLRTLAFSVTLALLGCAAAPVDPPAVPTTALVVAEGVDVAPHELPKPVETFTDDQIVALLSTFNAGQVDLATIAHERSRDPRVQAFAVVLRDDHHAALTHELALQERLVAHPPTERMRDMQRRSAAEAAKLRSLEGHELDAEFLADQVTTQRDALAMLDVQLIPSAKRADVRAHLADFRDHVDRHLRDATALAREVGGPFIARK